jgi:hypothetical protein
MEEQPIEQEQTDKPADKRKALLEKVNKRRLKKKPCGCKKKKGESE